jgi:hypothetical protein
VTAVIDGGFAKNVDVLACHDLDGKPWFQMAMQEVGGRYYLYGAHFKASGWAMVDVTDPARPDYLKLVPGPDLGGQCLSITGGISSWIRTSKGSTFSGAQCSKGLHCVNRGSCVTAALGG